MRERAVRHFFWSEPGPLPWFSRITRHESRITAFHRVLRPSGGEKCRLGPPTMVFAKHETRDTNHGLHAFHESQLPYPRFPTISHDFPVFPGPPTPLRRSSVHVSTRRTPFLLSRPDCRAVPRRPVTAFPRAVGRHGAAMARHGRPPSPAPATRTFLFTGRQIFLLERTSPPPMVFTNHETRITNHGLYAFHETRITAFFSHASTVG